MKGVSKHLKVEYKDSIYNTKVKCDTQRQENKRNIDNK